MDESEVWSPLDTLETWDHWIEKLRDVGQIGHVSKHRKGRTQSKHLLDVRKKKRKSTKAARRVNCRVRSRRARRRKR